MSWKPCRGHGIGFQNAFNRETKYRCLLADYDRHPVGYMEWSKAYYHWLVAERDMNKQFGRTVSIGQLYGSLVSPTLISSFEQHKNICYKPLQKYMKP